MTKIVINKSGGGFNLSEEAYKRLSELGNIPIVRYDNRDTVTEKVIYDHDLSEGLDISQNYFDWKFNKSRYGWEKQDKYPYGRYWCTWLHTDLFRSLPALIQTVEELGRSANGPGCTLHIVEIPDDVNWYIASSEYGTEWVAEHHRTWN